MVGNVTTVKLTNGLVLKKGSNGKWPALKDVAEIYHACEICPIRKYCDDNNEFDCSVYGMFDGFYLEDEFVDQFPSNRWPIDELLRIKGVDGDMVSGS